MDYVPVLDMKGRCQNTQTRVLQHMAPYLSNFTSPLVGAHRVLTPVLSYILAQTLSLPQSGNNPARKVALCPFHRCRN